MQGPTQCTAHTVHLPSVGTADSLHRGVFRRSLPQKPYRNKEEQVRFKAGLRGMNRWYSHPFAPTLLMTTPLPTGAAYTNTRPHFERGWCRFEIRISALVKNKRCLWDMSKISQDFNHIMDLRTKAGGKRPCPHSPDAVAKEIRDGVASGALAFTSGGDMEVVIDLYTRGFVEAFDTYLSITDNNMGIVEYQDFGWDEEDGRAFAEAIRYAEEHCTKNGRTLTFLMKGNNFGEKSSKLLKEAAADQKCISVDIET